MELRAWGSGGVGGEEVKPSMGEEGREGEETTWLRLRAAGDGDGMDRAVLSRFWDTLRWLSVSQMN